MNKGVCILFFTVCSLQICNAQQVVPAGGHLNKQDVSVEWIIAGNLFNNVFVVDDQPGNKSALLEANKSESFFKVYPSYTKDLVTIEIKSTDITVYQLNVFNTLGAKVMQRILLDKAVIKIDLSNQNSGLYFLKISEYSKDKILFTQKVVKL